MDLKTKDIDNAWLKLGFEIDYAAADVKAKLIIDGKVVKKTFRSHGSGRIRRQAITFGSR